MKLFLDRNKTLLPRIDVIYLLTRIMTLLGILWFASVGTYSAYDSTLIAVVVGTYIFHLVFFAFAIRGTFDLKMAYLSAIIYDLIFVPLFVSYTGAIDSTFYLVFFLTVGVAAYVLTFWFATTVAVIVTVVYLGVLAPSLSVESLFPVTMRIGFLWVCFLAISYGSEFLRRSEARLLKLFDTLNMRTAELENQTEVDALFTETALPIRGGCGDEIADAA